MEVQSKWMTCFGSHSNIVSEYNQNLSFLIPCHHSFPWNTNSIFLANATWYVCLCQFTVEMWEVFLFQIFDEKAEAGGECIAFCLISSSITLMDLPVLANTEKLACLLIFHCIAMLLINKWIFTVPLSLEKDASGDIYILSAALHLFSGKEIVS